MLDAIKGFTTPPIFPNDEKKTHTARAFNALLLVTLGITIFVGAASLLVLPDKLLTLVVLVIALVIHLSAHRLIHAGFIRPVAIACISGAWLIVTLSMLQIGGLSSSMSVYYLVILVLTATLLGQRAVTFYATLTLAASVLTTVLQASGVVRRQPPPDFIVSWLIQVSAILITYVPLKMTIGNLQEALDNVQRQLRERQQAEQGLRNTETHLKLALSAANMWTWEWRIKENRLIRTADPLKIFKTTVDENLESFFAVLHADDRQHMREALEHCIRAPDSLYHQEYRIVWPDGTIRWITSWGQVYRDGAGQPELLIGVAEDVTGRKQIEEALANERKLLRTVIDFLPDNIYVKDRNSRFLLNNAMSIQLMGASRQQELLGKTDYDFFTDEQVGPWFAEEQMVMQSDQPVLEREEFRPWKKGKRRWIVVSLIPFKNENGEVIGLIGRDKDISDLKRVEDRERAIAQSLRGVVEAVDELIVIQDIDTFYRRAVELARDKIRVERCAVLLFDPTHKFIRGTYGTDDQGNTTNEHALRSSISAQELETLTNSHDLWIVHEMEHTYWDGEQIQIIGSGWIADTMIRTGDQPIAIFSNDTAITKAPLDPIQQEAIVLYCSLMGNILNHKQVDSALRESEARYRIISELISDYAYAYEVRSDGSYSMYWITEHSFKRVTGYDWNEVSRPYIIDHPDDVERSSQSVEQVIKGQRSEGEYRIITRDGEIRWVYVQRQPEWSEAEQRVVRFYGAAKDITERKRAEEALAKERNLLRTVIDFLPDNIVVKDRQSRFLVNNIVSMGLLGVSRQEDLLGKTDFDFFPTEIAQKWFDQEQSVIQSGQPIIRGEEYQPWKKLERRWVVFSKIPLKNELGDVTGIVGMESDITHLKQVEDRERAIAQSLRGVVEAIDELITIEDLDTFYRRAVELAREKLKIERCSVQLFDPTRTYVTGTYGTDDQGRTIDEYDMQTPVPALNRSLFEEENKLWIVQDREYLYWSLSGAQKVGFGWVAVTIIRVGQEPFGIFSNDTAITKTPLDTIQQEAIVLYCSLLGNILGRRRIEEEVRRLNSELERRVLERTRDLEVAAEVAKQATKALELDVLLSELVERTRSSFELYETALYLYDEKTNSMRLVAAAGDYVVKATEAARIVVNLDKTKGHLAKAAQSKTTLLVNDVSDSPEYIPNPYLPYTRAEMIVPMMIGDQMIGALDVQHKRISGFGQDDLRVFASLADQIAIAIRNAQLFVEMQAARRESETLFRIGEAMNAATSYVEIIDAIVKAIGDTPLMIWLGIYENYKREHATYVDIVAQYLPDQKKTVATSVRIPVLEALAQSSDPYVIEDTEQAVMRDIAEATIFRDLGVRSILAAGASLGQHQIGVLAFTDRQPHQFSTYEHRLMSGASDLAAAAVERGRLLEEAETARKVAEEANRIKSQFLANMSHELRTPLNAILNFTAFVADGIMGPVNEEQIEILQQSLSSGKHLLSLINDILDVTKIEAGLMELFIQKVDLNQVLDSTVSVAKGLIKDKPIEFTADIERHLPSTYGDIRRLRQVFLNLVSNAVKFTPRGKIGLKAYFENGAIHIMVSDTGIGIAPQDRDMIFQSFKQAPNDLLETVGTGLGLPISKYFVESHGGKIWLQSEVEVGTTFFVELPILTEEQASAKNADMKK